MMLIMMLMIRCDDSDTVDDDQKLDHITLFLVFTTEGRRQNFKYQAIASASLADYPAMSFIFVR